MVQACVSNVSSGKKETVNLLGCFSNIRVVAFAVWVGLGGQGARSGSRFRRRRSISSSTRKEKKIFEETKFKTKSDRGGA